MTPEISDPNLAGYPLVSCLLLTADRPAFVPHAIRRFLEQDYPRRELLILDDGECAIQDLVPSHPLVRYLRLQERLTVGAKRNLGCREARGELVAHWDDDDWMATWRLSYQVEELLKFEADICGLRKLYFWGPRADQGWEYTYETGAQPWVAGGTMLYRRTLWETNPFPEINVGEDNAFVWSSVSKAVLPLVDPRFYVATIHPANTSPKDQQAPRWQPASVGEIQQILGEEWPAWSQLLFPAPEEPAIVPGDGPAQPLTFFTPGRRSHLVLPEFAALQASRPLPVTRRWELGFALFQSRLSGTMAVLDCSITLSDLGLTIAELYPHVLYRSANPLGNGQYLMPPTVPDGAFDRVFCLDTITHFAPRQRNELVEMLAASLKPGGWLVVTAAGIDSGELESLCASHGLYPLQSAAAPGTDDLDILGAVFYRGPQPEPPVQPRLVLSLLTWNTRMASMESLEAHVREARMLRRLGCDAGICVVDNGSTDGTAEELRKLEGLLDVPHRFFFNPENAGNSRARNLMIDHMLESGADYLLFVDGDIEIIPFSSFVMLRHMENCGSRLGCAGAYSFGCTPDRKQATPYLFSLSGCRVHASDTLAWTQYGIFRRRMFEEGVRFDVNGPFGEPGHGLEDVDLAFQMNQAGYLNHYFSGVTYLHRNLSSSVGLLSDSGMEPTDRYYRRKEYMLQKWEGVPQIAEGPLRWVRQASAPWHEVRANRTAVVRLGPSAPAIDVPGEVMEWVDRSVSQMLDRTELTALAAIFATYDWSLSDLVVEIGAYLGTTTVFMAKVAERLGRHITILSIDPFERCTPDNLNPQGSYTDYIQNIQAHGVQDRCLALAAFAEQAAPAVPARIGVLVIDGSHHYEAVKADLDLYIPKVVSGGYIFIDDYGPAYPDVIRAIDEYLAAHPHLEVVVKSYYVILKQQKRIPARD